MNQHQIEAIAKEIEQVANNNSSALSKRMSYTEILQKHLTQVDETPPSVDIEQLCWDLMNALTYDKREGREIENDETFAKRKNILANHGKIGMQFTTAMVKDENSTSGFRIGVVPTATTLGGNKQNVVGQVVGNNPYTDVNNNTLNGKDFPKVEVDETWIEKAWEVIKNRVSSKIARSEEAYAIFKTIFREAIKDNMPIGIQAKPDTDSSVVRIKLDELSKYYHEHLDDVRLKLDLDEKIVEIENLLIAAPDRETITRFEVIDYKGRRYVAHDIQIEESVQDEGRTLKVFVTGQGNVLEK